MNSGKREGSWSQNHSESELDTSSTQFLPPPITPIPRDSNVGFVVVAVQLLSWVWLCDPKDCGQLGSSVHGVLQARILEFPSPRDLPYPGIEPKIPSLAGEFFTPEPTGIDLFLLP